MRLLVIADIDNLSWPGPSEQADIVISCGDVSDEVILQAARAAKAGVVFAVRGNHDRNEPFPVPVVNLHLNVVEFAGFRFGGFAGCWKYKPRGHHLYTQDEARRLLAVFPAVDVLVTHNSPSGIHDVEFAVHQGFEALNDYIERARPHLHVHGHQHVRKQTVLGDTVVSAVYGWEFMTLESL